jgi:hypothetical protein
MKSLIFGNKKGAVTDPIYVGAFILVTALTMVTCLYIWFSFQEQMTIVVNGTASESAVVNAMVELRTAYTSMDYMIPLMVGGLLIVSLIFAFKTGASVMYAFVSIFLWAFSMLISAVYTNIYEVFETSFPSVTTEVPILTYIMHNLKWVTLAWLALICIVMFTRNKQEDDALGPSKVFAPEAYYGE